ncbi:MAG TPA: Fe-S cluster assembly protein SufD [Pyrinomonadaceae bacterium]|jgi:Fe-S cluster assembly protein SufD|nr:Fe-S cluster assembly protein SufD [Pyrinomonadaceae bacterium]
MTLATKEQSTYGAAFRASSEGARGGVPSWVAQLREEAFGRFEELGFPTTDEEDWKYTNVAPVERAGFRPAAGPAPGAFDAEAAARFVNEEASRSRLVFVNGFLQEHLSSTEALPEGVVATDLGRALGGEHAERIRERLSETEGADAFRSLNTAFLAGGAFILVPRGVSVEAPVQLLFLSDPEGDAAAAFPRVLVLAERESSIRLVESYASAGEAAYFTNAAVDVLVGEGARVTHYKVQAESEEAFHVASTRAEVGRAGSYDLTTVTLGARLSRHTIEVLLDNEGGECRVDGLYIVGDGQHADTHSLIDHREPNCASRQTYKGILDGRSRAVFNGRVFVRPGAGGTDAQQSNKNLLLSPEARVDTKPQLEIFADDVKCSHGATVGQLEEEELFYLSSRGLHPDLARNLLTYGFAEEIVARIGLASIRAQLDEAILNRLQARLEV